MVAPMQRFVTVRDGKKGLTLIVKGLPEYELKLHEPGVLALTLLRCVGKLSGRDLITRPGGAAGWWNETPEAQCLGTHTFEYSVFPHAGNEGESWPSILKEMESFTVPPIVVKRKNEQAVMEKSLFSFQSDLPCNLTALKIADEDESIVLRVNNPVEKHTGGMIHCEIPMKNAFRGNMNEQIVRPLDIENGRDIRHSIKPFEVVTVVVRF
jgi:alpha-mannosidase